MTFTVRSGWSARCYPGLSSCGDAAVVVEGARRSLFAVVDALGHGPDAAKSAEKLRGVLQQNAELSLKEIFQACDQALAGTGMRGAVMSAIQVSEDQVVFAGVGNVDLFGPPNASRPMSVAGVLGRGIRVFREFDLKVGTGDRWVLASDGIRSRDFSKVLESTRQLEATVAAQQLVERAGRNDDDATALVLDFGAKA